MPAAAAQDNLTIAAFATIVVPTASKLEAIVLFDSSSSSWLPHIAEKLSANCARCAAVHAHAMRASRAHFELALWSSRAVWL